MRVTLLILLCSLCISITVFAQQGLEDGKTRKYVNKHKIGYFDGSTEMKWAEVTDEIWLTATKDGVKFAFRITAPNYHSCTMKGEAEKKGNVYEYREKIGAGNCVLQISASNEIVRLSDIGLICRSHYCGARGSINGTTFRRLNE